VNYTEFLATKAKQAVDSGFDHDRDKLPPMLFEWQKDIVLWALKKGRAALFEDCGMGKTPQQLAWAQAVSDREQRPVLILAPLAVSEQTKREGQKFGIPVTICRDQSDVQSGVNITNYEMLSHFDTSAFVGVVLDESSILKAYMGKTKRMLVDAFAQTPYRLACTATPAPNDLMELLNHAEYLGVMKSNEALSIWFIADQTNSGTYRLKGHAAADFWRWVTTWAICMDKPSDIGYPDDGFNLPPLDEKDVILPISEIAEDLTEGMFRNIDMNATGFYRERRFTQDERVRATAEIVNATDEPCVVWCGMNEESEALRKAIPGALEVKGSDTPKFKEDAAMAFIDGKARVLISKASIFGWGLNFQHCHIAVFCGMDYSYEGYYQAVRRLHRFGQQSPVTVYRVLGSTEQQILDAQRRKADLLQDMHSSMADAMREVQTQGLRGQGFKLDVTKQTASAPNWLKEETA